MKIRERIQKTPNESNISKFVRCWNIYSGLIFETTDGISKRNDAVQCYTEMCLELGRKSMEIYDGVSVEPDFFPMLGSDDEIDYVMGFSASVYGRPIGRIGSLTVRGSKLFIAAEAMTIAIDTKVFSYAKTRS